MKSTSLSTRQSNEPTSFSMVLASGNDNFQKIIRSGNTSDLIRVIAKATGDFLSVNSQAGNHAMIALQFAQDIIETRPDWKIDDVIYFFKFVRQRQDIEDCRIFGNTITGIKLMQIASVYETHKAMQREENLRQLKASETEQERHPTDPEIVRHHVSKIIERMKPEKEKSVLSVSIKNYRKLGKK